jgi:hypothetical protein
MNHHSARVGGSLRCEGEVSCHAASGEGKGAPVVFRHRAGAPYLPWHGPKLGFFMRGRVWGHGVFIGFERSEKVATFLLSR